MSRCFSFPPPEYELSDERIGIMMELIKLKREKERREEKRERRKGRKDSREKRRKDRREERRAKRKEGLKENRTEEVEKCISEVESQVKNRDAETEQSSLSEEHGLPVSCASPGNIKERKRNHYCYTSESSSSSSIHQFDRRLPDAVVQGLGPEFLDCKHLVQKLLRPQLDDSDWLYPERRREEKRQRYESDAISCSRTSVPWPPRAQYLHQIDSYAFPYIIPF